MRGEIEGIKEIMQKSENLGMQTFDTALFRLYIEGRITLDEALKNADSANNLRLRIKLHSKDNGLEEVQGTSTSSQNDEQSTSSSSGGLSLSLEEKDEDEEEKPPTFGPAEF
jgi:twitching motility protein PilU